MKQVVDDSKDQHGVSIPKIKEQWPKKLWSMVEQAKQGNNTFNLALMKEIYADPNQYEFDANSICGDIRSVKSQESLDEDLQELPQFVGEHEAKLKIRVLPLVQGKTK